ncbi:MAG: PrsW family intramembrane metalloprotease [Persicimonas sp.]
MAALKPTDGTGKKIALFGCGCLLLIATVIALLLVGAETIYLFSQKPLLSVVSVVLALVVCVPYAAVFLWIDRNEKEPFYLLAASFFWGAVLAIAASGLVNSLFGGIAGSVLGDPQAAHQLTASISAPIIEEVTKGMALLVIFIGFARHFDNVLDGVVYGAFVGLGFATVENFHYYVQNPDITSAFVLFIVRGIIASIGSHACYTALTGAGLGMFRVMRGGALRWLLPPLGLAMAMFAHFAWNTFAGVIAEMTGVGIFGVALSVLILSTPFVLLVVVTIFLSLRHETKLIRKYLQEESDSVVDAEDIDLLVPARRRLWRSLELAFSGQIKDWWELRRRSQRLVELAFEKWHMDQELEKGSQQRAQKHARRITELRAELA